jgi:uncharacterized protein (TIGR02246 family)
MNRITLALTLALAAGCATTHAQETTMNAATQSTFDPTSQVDATTALLRSYESALNAADVDAIVALYADDGIFMAQHREPAIGRAQVETAYREILGMIQLDIEFLIDEVVVVSPMVAYARTRSSGTTTILANQAQVTEGNQELFILVRSRESDAWRIGRYIFSTTQPRG